MAQAQINSRKRLRSSSNELPFGVQLKYFVNQQLVDSMDSNKMKEIQDKTIKMLFENANDKTKNVGKMEQFRNNICLIGNGKLNTLKSHETEKVKSVQRKCNLCVNESAAELLECKNCNLNVCSRCATACVQCNEPICQNCVNLFGCTTSDTTSACCENCKHY